MLRPPNGPFVRLMNWIAAKLVVLAAVKLVWHAVHRTRLEYLFMPSARRIVP